MAHLVLLQDHKDLLDSASKFRVQVCGQYVCALLLRQRRITDVNQYSQLMILPTFALVGFRVLRSIPHLQRGVMVVTKIPQCPSLDAFGESLDVLLDVPTFADILLLFAPPCRVLYAGTDSGQCNIRAPP